MMRRPLKPFVTEYKGARRVTPSLGETSSFESERPGSKPFEARTEAQPDNEESYDAAMRAADALFASPSKPKSGLASEPDSPAARAETEGRASDRGGGRILRVIDEPPSPQYAALESEFAPKRRGRKPGSKNKPKIPALAAAHESGDFATTHAAEMTPSVVAADVPLPRLPVPAQRRMAALTAVAVSPRSEKRFPWVRDRLKPGEDWKRRRLPKVCW